MAGAGGTEVGRVSVRVVPNLDDFRDKVKKELEKVEQMEAEVTVSLDLEKFKAQIEEVKALLKSISDETVNIKVDKDGGVQKVQDGLKGAASEAENLGKKLKNALGDGEGERRISKLSNLIESFGNFAQRAASQAGQLAGQIGGQLADSARSFGTSLTQMIVQMLIWIPLLSVAAAGITFLVGIIAAAIGGLPAILFGLAAPIAAVVIGLDGMKNAFKSLAPQFDSLKSRLESTFEKGLKPTVEILKGIMPIVSDGLNGAAEAVNRFVNSMAATVTSKEQVGGLASNFDNLKTVLKDAPQFLDAASTGINQFIASILNAAAQSGAFKIMGKTISDVLIKLKGFFDQSVQDGSLMKGLDNLDKVLVSITGMFTALLRNSLKFFNGATPGAVKFFDAITHFFLRIDFEKLGKIFGDALDKVGTAINNIPPQTIDDITDAFGRLADSVAELFSGKSFDILISSFQLFLDIITGVITGIDWLLERLADLGDFIAGIPDWFGQLFDKGKELLDGLRQGAFEKWVEFTDWLADLGNKAVSFVGDVAKKLIQKGRDLITGIRDGAVEKFNDVKDFITSIPQRIWDAIGEVSSFLKQKGRDFVNGLRDGAKEAFNNVVAFVRNIPAAIISFFAGAGSWLLAAGKSVIQGLINGISAKAGALFQKAKDIANSVIGIVGGAFKIGSPSRVMHDMGQFVIQGFENGMTAASKSMLSTADGIASDVLSTFDPLSMASDMRVSGSDISAVGTSQLTVAGQVTSDVGAQVASALAGWTVEIDANGIARLVNKANNVKARRG